MKKRLLSALLALALVFVLLPTTALAGVAKGSDYDISINGTNYVFSDSETCYFKSSFTSTEPSSPYLKLTKSSDTITVTVSGYVTVSDINVHNNFSTQDKINLIITGNKGSTLNIECKDTYGAALETYQSGDITIKGGITVNANFSADNTDKYTDCYGIRASKNLIITGKGTTVNAVNADDAAAVKVDGNITVSDGAQLKATNKYSKKVTNYTGKAYAIECGGLSISGNNTKVTAKTSKGEKAISGTVYNLTENDDYKLTFKAGMYEGAPSFDYPKPMDKALGYEYVEITQAPTDPYVFIAGEPAIMDQETPIPGGTGTYLYKKTTYNGSFLTLKGVDITGTSSGPAQAIRFGKNGGYYTIELEGENKISGFSSGIVAPSVSGVNEVTVVLSGSGSLDISANQYAIDMQVGNLKFENTGKIKLTTGYVFTLPLNALRVKSGSITIDNTKYDIVGARQEKDYPTETISDSSAFTPDLLNGYTVGGETTLFKTITITPAAAKDSTISYNGKTLKQGKTITGENGGTATVDSKNNTITLKNFNGTAALSFDATLADSTLVLEGTNTLSSIVTTQKGLTISGSGSLTVGSIRVPNNTKHTANLTITGGATVIAGTATSDAKAIDITGNLTVNSGATLTATSKSDNVPTVQVGGNASFTGSTVTITNNSDRQGKSGEYSYAVSTGLYVGGTLDIKNAAKVTSTVIGGNAIYAKGDITISGDSTEVNAQNSAYKFSAISTNKTVNISDNSTVKAENLKRHQGDPTGDTDPSTGKTYNPCPAITGKIANKNSQNKLHIVGFTTSSAGSQNPTEGTPLNRDIAPGSVEPYIHHYKVTITRGDEVVRTPSPVVIDGHTLLNDTYYTITNGSKVAEGTKDNYNAFYDSETKTLKLNNAKISTTTKNAAIKISEDLTLTTITVTGTNELKGNHNHCIESYDNFTINGTGTLNMTNTNSSSSATSVIHCGPGKSLTIAAEVIIKNEAKPGNLILTVTDNAYSFAEGYNVYASTDVSGSPLEAYDAAKGSTYKYLRVTKENLAPTTPTPQTPFTIYGIPAQFVDGGMIATTGVTATSSNNINLPIDRVKWYTFTPVFGSDGRMDSVSDKTEATGNFEAGKYYVVEIKFVQDLSPFKSWDMKVSGWSDNDVYRQSVTARNDIEIYFLTPASAATHEHNWAENYDTVYHWKMCTYDGCTAIKDKALHVWNAWHTSNNEQQHSKSCSECSYSTPPHDIDLAYVSDGEQGHHLYCKHDGCTFVTGTTAHVYAEGSNICTDCGYNKSAPCDHTGDRAYTNNGDGTHKVTCKACGATIVEKQSHEFGPTGACIYCGATQSGGDPTPDNPGTIVIIRPAEEEKPAQQPNPSTGANDLVGLAVAAAVAAALGSAALLRKHD